MNDSVADCVDFVDRRDSGTFAMNQSVEDDLQGLFVIRHILCEDSFVLIGAMLDIGVFASYALAKTFCKHFVLVGVDELILEGR